MTASGLVVAAAVVGFVTYKHHHDTTTVSPNNSTAQASTSKAADNAQPASTSSNNSATSTPTSDESSLNGSLATPSGQLGTQHQQASSATTLIVPKSQPGLTATCSTISAASCVVIAKGPNGESLSVPADSNTPGSFNFDWTAKDYADGTWTIKVQATSSGQSATATIGTIEVQG